MTRTAIIAAMHDELKPLTRGWLHSRANGVDLWRWSFEGGEWIAACAGAGVERAARAFAEVEKCGEVDRVISVGWAGALREELLPGQAYDVSCVIDTRTGERFLTSCAGVLVGGLPRSQTPPRSSASPPPTKPLSSRWRRRLLQGWRSSAGFRFIASRESATATTINFLISIDLSRRTGSFYWPGSSFSCC